MIDIRRLVGKRSMEAKDFRHAGPRPAEAEWSGELESFFWNNTGPVVHKWHHYFPLYERYLQPFRRPGVRFLEIGVSKGGSLDMWRAYFGPEATLFGIDIDPACATFDGRSACVRIGSQDDPRFLASVVAEMGGVDVVLDDGSHISRHMRASIGVLFPLLPEGGLYMVEDLHAAYWPQFGGGYGKGASFMSDIKTMLDDMHHWYHDRGERIGATAGHLKAVHVHDSMVVLEKAAVPRPCHSMVGGL